MWHGEMKGKIRSVAIYLTFILLMTLFQMETLASTNTITKENINKTIFVNQEGTGDFNTISEALTYAKSGDTIIIQNGTYPEILNIKNNVDIRGEYKFKTIINPISEKNKYAIRLGAEGASLQNLVIKNDAPGLYTTGIKITYEYSLVKDCIIYDTPVGIAIWTSFNKIINCTFYGCDDEGIALLGSDYSNCDNNLISKCVFYYNCDGIELQHSMKNIIADCEFFNNTHTGIDAISSKNNNNIIKSCKITNNKVHGIYFSSSSNNSIIDCEIMNNKDGNLINSRNSDSNIIIFSEISYENENNLITKSTSMFNKLKVKTNKDFKLGNLFEKIIEKFVDLSGNYIRF